MSPDTKVTYYSQVDLAIAYAKRTGARLALPTFLLDKELDRALGPLDAPVSR